MKLNKMIKQVRASSAHRFWECAGSVRAEAMAPLQDESDVAREGTAAHRVFELCLKTGKEASDFLDAAIELHTGDEWVVDESMVEHVQAGVDLVRSKRGNGKMWTESNIRIETKPVPTVGQFDCGWYGRYKVTPGYRKEHKLKQDYERQLHVLDLKYGQGKATEATDNKQLKIYGRGKLLELERAKQPVDSVHLWIYQPRSAHGDGPFRHVRLEPYDLLEFEGDLNVKVAAALAPNAPFKAGPWCLYCRAHATCQTAEQTTLAAMRRKFTKHDRDRIGELLFLLPTITRWCAEIKTLGSTMGHNDETPTGWKVGPGRNGRKQWKGVGKGKEQEKFAKVMIPKLVKELKLSVDQVAPRKLGSVAMIERLMPKEQRAKLKKFYFQTRGKDTLMPENDSRQGITANLFFEAEGDDGQH